MNSRGRGMDVQRARAALDRLVAKAKAEYADNRDSAERLRLFYLKPNSGQTVGRVAVRSKAPRSEWQMANPMVISPRWSDAEVERFIYRSIVKLPILKGPIAIH